MHRLTIWAGALCLVCAVAGAAQAQPVNYGDFLGGPDSFDFLQVTEDSSSDATPLYGAPIALPDRLRFLPLTFTSAASSGVTTTTHGELTMVVRAAPGFLLSSITISELADVTLLGSGSAATFADIAGDVSLLDLTPGTHGTIADSLVYSPGNPYALPLSFVEVEGGVTFDLSTLGISELRLTLDNLLTTASETGTSSLIQKKSIDILATVSLIPEPATAALLAAGALLLARRRRAG